MSDQIYKNSNGLCDNELDIGQYLLIEEKEIQEQEKKPQRE